MTKWFTASATLLTAAMCSVATAAAEQSQPWDFWHQDSASEFASRIAAFDLYTLYFIVPITLFVLGLLIYVAVRFNAKANPVASKTSHNSLVEAVWTIVPIIILVMIAFPSFGLLKYQMVPTEEPALTVKATGFQWYWGYEYQDESALSFDSVMMQEDEREASGKQDKSVYPRLLAVDNELVVPVGKMVRVLITASDVLHAFTVPAFGFKMDAVPGRLNETWFKAEREGIFYGQCSEICGTNHAFMPIAVRVVSEAQFASWKAAAAADLKEANKALMAAISGKVNVAGN